MNDETAVRENTSRDDALNTPVWLVQYKAASADELRDEWDATTEDDEIVECPKIPRRIEEIGLNDFVLFWDALRQHLAFSDFEIFTMPNAANVFRVTREQWEVIFDALADAS